MHLWHVERCLHYSGLFFHWTFRHWFFLVKHKNVFALDKQFKLSCFPMIIVRCRGHSFCGTVTYDNYEDDTKLQSEPMLIADRTFDVRASFGFMRDNKSLVVTHRAKSLLARWQQRHRPTTPLVTDHSLCLTASKQILMCISGLVHIYGSYVLHNQTHVL